MRRREPQGAGAELKEAPAAGQSWRDRPRDPVAHDKSGTLTVTYESLTSYNSVQIEQNTPVWVRIWRFATPDRPGTEIKSLYLGEVQSHFLRERLIG